MAGRLKRPPRIDVHAHYLPHDYRQAARAAGYRRPDGTPSLPEWSEADAITLMDALSIRTAMLSIPAPGVHFGDDLAARELARSVNRQGVELVRSRRRRFGLFAALPLPDIAGSISEAIHALDDLGADGVTIQTNHGGLYLGDPVLDPLMQLLDRRRAVVFIHPTWPSCCGCLSLAFDRPRPILEIMFETTRAVTNMLYRRTFQRYPGLRMIIPHAGAALPVLAARIVDQAHAPRRRLATDVGGDLWSAADAALRSRRLPDTDPGPRPARHRRSRTYPLWKRLAVHAERERRPASPTGSTRPICLMRTCAEAC